MPVTSCEEIQFYVYYLKLQNQKDTQKFNFLTFQLHCDMQFVNNASTKNLRRTKEITVKELVMQNFPLEKASEEERSAASPVEIEIAETSAPTLTEANTQHEGFSISRVAKLNHEDWDVAGNNLHLNRTE
ncbi:hypothetical protein PTKIN_Ptkin03bG0226900 [Pterospermum kingtungense]